ncbi:hypothetical protein [Nocardiopsis valliformis]|uniref:hypothetical protein n=1 Tax=Nocardiopsis valliformis TaxID=239974 RepID=UPI000347976D|nr:hypothetical protein [Nocardiopsis valliformis]
MKLMWKKTANPEPPIEAAPAPAPAAEPAPAVAEDQAPVVARPAQINPTTVIASLVTLASVVFTTWSVFDMATPAAPDLVALAAGAGVELVWLYILATEWQQAGRTGHLSRGLTVTGWVLAAVAAVIITVHGLLTVLALAVLAVLPLAAKAGWHWQTRLRAAATRARLAAQAEAERERAETARRKAEEERRLAQEQQRRDQELSQELTEEQEKELARLRREAVFVSAKSAAELELDAARARADQERALADIRRQAEQQMAVDEGAADIEVRRIEMANRIRLASPVYSVTEVPTLTGGVPNDASALSGGGTPGTPGIFTGSGAGFGAMMRTAQAPHTGVDQPMPGVPGTVPTSPAHRSVAEAEANRAAIAQAYRHLFRQGGAEPSIAAVAAQAKVSDRTAGRHLRALGLID